MSISRILGSNNVGRALKDQTIWWHAKLLVRFYSVFRPFLLFKLSKSDSEYLIYGKNSHILASDCISWRRQGVQKKNAPQFLLNFSGHKHARRLGYDSLERWDP